MGQGYCEGPFVLNIYEVVNQIKFYAYIVDSFDVFHARLGHVNSLYVIKLS